MSKMMIMVVIAATERILEEGSPFDRHMFFQHFAAAAHDESVLI